MRSIISLAILYVFWASPAYAHQDPPPTPIPAPAGITQACDLNASLLAMHTMILNLGQEASDAGNTATHLSHTSLWRPYRDVELKWSDLSTRVRLGLETLTDLSIDLDDVSDTPQKAAALQLTAAYQDSLKKMLDYTRTAVYFEHSENLVSMDQYPRNGNPTRYLYFGLNRSAIPVNGNNASHQFFDLKFPEARDALRELDLPEHRYAKACNVTF
jgi:hypothetical protein